MQAVTNAFKTAALSPTRKPVRKATLTLVDNDIMAGNLGLTANTIDNTIVGPSKAVNGVNNSSAHWAFADPFTTLGAGARCFPADDLYPIGIPDDAGWWGNAASDASGNIGGGGESFIITYQTPITVTMAYWYANAWTGYIKDFVVSYDNGNGSFTTLATVTGNTALSWTFNFSVPTTISRLKIVITKIQYPDAVAVLVEFGANYAVDISASLQGSNVLVEREPDNATLEVGDVSAGEATLRLDNTAGYFGPYNANSPYAGLLRSNRRIALQYGFQYDDGSTEFVPFGTFYSMNWLAVGGEVVATVTAQDRMKKLRERKYQYCPLSVGLTVDNIIISALQDAGLTPVEYIVNASTTVIPYAWADPSQSHMDYIADLAAAVGGVVYFDENNIFHFEDLNFLRRNKQTSVLTLTDFSGIIKPIDDWEEGNVKNRILVQSNAVSLAASAQVWSLSEVLTIRAFDTLTYVVFFTSGVINVQTPVLSDVDAGVTLQSWTVFAQTGILVLANSNLFDSYARGITINGQALVNNSSLITCEDTTFVNIDGPRELSISNPFIQNKTIAQGLGNDLLTIYKNPPSRLNVQCQGLPHVELGDRVTIQSSKMGITADYWLIRHTFNDEGDFQSNFDLVAVQDQLPTRATMFFNMCNFTLGGSTLIDSGPTGAPYRPVNYELLIADGTIFTHSCFLGTGVYTLNVMGVLTDSSGKVDWYVDGILIGTQDWYSGSHTGQWIVRRIENVSISTPGYHVLKGVVNGKNAASSSTDIYLIKMWLKQAAD